MATHHRPSDAFLREHPSEIGQAVREIILRDDQGNATSVAKRRQPKRVRERRFIEQRYHERRGGTTTQQQQKNVRDKIALFEQRNLEMVLRTVPVGTPEGRV